MQFYYHQSFKKDFKRIPAPIQKKLYRQLDAFMKHGITHPGLSGRKMTSQDESIWELRVDLHYRVTFTIVGDIVALRRIGTHEIYRKP